MIHYTVSKSTFLLRQTNQRVMGLVWFQITQGMTYLHNKDLINKDLRSRNVFIEGNRAIITDYGLYNLLCMSKHKSECGHLPVTKHNVFYLAPECIRAISKPEFISSFDYSTDVYAFG